MMDGRERGEGGGGRERERRKGKKGGDEIIASAQA